MSHDGPREEDFRALARSSPWRFQTLHFTHRSSPSDDDGGVEAWLDRPSQCVTVRSKGVVGVAGGVPYSGSAGTDRPLGVPEFRADGLVARRPPAWHLVRGDPMWRDYRWTAMLDPDELDHGVQIRDVAAAVRLGRETWSATCVPLVGAGEDWVGGYDPRCGCCPLLDSRASRLVEYGPDHPITGADGIPTTYRVQLDVQTAVVVRIDALDRAAGLVLSNEIHGVDTRLEPPGPSSS
ncbi:hypothetical protein [Allobranchiibius sp. CTAmp26]|uniref:hypothetical protein n=1 Tax=Allobranchiibius sp. CTAmp26 TaxID=2815214 RepID=UPI001AA182C2|nr:hypothetical protein [Allobranchiibius sp. CTAmp26]MBO1754639.1 hypothetical protein [Allobranchiibius sp. CTAmp26]